MEKAAQVEVKTLYYNDFHHIVDIGAYIGTSVSEHMHPFVPLCSTALSSSPVPDIIPPTSCHSHSHAPFLLCFLFSRAQPPMALGDTGKDISAFLVIRSDGIHFYFKWNWTSLHVFILQPLNSAGENKEGRGDQG